MLSLAQLTSLGRSTPSAICAGHRVCWTRLHEYAHPEGLSLQARRPRVRRSAGRVRRGCRRELEDVSACPGEHELGAGCRVVHVGLIVKPRPWALTVFSLAAPIRPATKHSLGGPRQRQANGSSCTRAPVASVSLPFRSPRVSRRPVNCLNQTYTTCTSPRLQNHRHRVLRGKAESLH